MIALLSEQHIPKVTNTFVHELLQNCVKFKSRHCTNIDMAEYKGRIDIFLNEDKTVCSGIMESD